MQALELLSLKPRHVAFDLRRTPLQWIPGEAHASALANALHLILPAGERWFVRVYQQAMPHIRDERLRREAKGFMGQEATHANAHLQALEYLGQFGVDPTRFDVAVEKTFVQPLSGRTHEALLNALGVIAAIEHFTATLGHWVLDAQGLDRAQADLPMLSLLRWHGAEEVEHRSVAFDVFEHLGGTFQQRARAMLWTFPRMTRLWFQSADVLLEHDPDAPPMSFLGGLARAANKHLVPGRRLMLGVVPSYLQRDFHPVQMGSVQPSLTYLEQLPLRRRAPTQEVRS